MVARVTPVSVVLWRKQTRAASHIKVQRIQLLQDIMRGKDNKLYSGSMYLVCIVILDSILSTYKNKLL